MTTHLYNTMHTHLFVQLVGKSISHHGFTSTRWTMKQHDHASPIGDGIIQAHPLAATLVVLKVANSIVDELLLFLGKNHLNRQGEGGHQ